MRALAAPVLAIAEAVAPLRLDRPAFQFTRADVVNDIRVAFALAIAGQLAELTGLRSAERVAGVSAGRKQAEAEQRNRPRRVGDVIVAPASVDVPGGVIAPGVQPR